MPWALASPPKQEQHRSIAIRTGEEKTIKPLNHDSDTGTIGTIGVIVHWENMFHLSSLAKDHPETGCSACNKSPVKELLTILFLLKDVRRPVFRIHEVPAGLSLISPPSPCLAIPHQG